MKRRYWLVTFLAMFMGIASGILAEEIRATEFILEDEQGRVCAKLWATDEGPALSLFDERGTPRLELALFFFGPRIALFDENGKYRFSLVVAEDGPETGQD